MFQADSLIDFSIIVPARNEAQHIGMCLDSLLAQDFKGSYEVIVVDGMSNDTTAEIVASYSRRDERVRLISNPDRITPAAFNRGIRRARGKILLTVGAHSYLPIDYLSQIFETFQNHPSVDCLGGRVVRKADTQIGRAIEAARDSLLGGGLSIRNYMTKEQITHKPNVADIWRRSVFEKVGLFDERFVKNQDNEFNLRTIRAGLETLYSPRIVVYYHVPDDFKKLFRQVFGYTSYMPMISVKHHCLLYARFAIPTTALLFWLVLSILGTIDFLPLAIPLALVTFYAPIMMGGALVVSLRVGKLRYWPVICLAYLTIHIAVSLGYLYGISRLFNPSLVISLWRDSQTLAQNKSVA